MSAGTGDQCYTARYAGITSQAVSFPIPVSSFSIIVDDGAEFYILGNHAASSAGYLTNSYSVSGLNIMANKTICTVGADAAIDFTLIAWR